MHAVIATIGLALNKINGLVILLTLQIAHRILQYLLLSKRTIL
jgi:hypothetical protein